MNKVIARFEDVEDEFYSAEGHVYGAWGYEHQQGIGIVPSHVGVEEPREELGEYWLDDLNPDDGPYIARDFEPNELVIGVCVNDDRGPRRRFFDPRHDG